MTRDPICPDLQWLAAVTAPGPSASLRRAAAAPALVIFALAAAIAAPLPLSAQDTISIGQLREALEDSAYATPGLRRFVSEAAEQNRRLPELLRSYRTRVESEISILQVEPDGREVALQVEQVASDVLWRRDEETVQEVVGYRARTSGLAPSVLTMFEVPWVVPTLYGERIDLVRWNVPTVDEEGRVLRRRAMHPLGPDRNRIYRFSGGDTILTLSLPERTLRLVRVEVEPVHAPDLPTLLFEGHMDIDADRHQIVRMRGRMISARPEETGGDRLLGAIASGATFVEFESVEFDRFWLPRYQRIEVQAISRLVDTRVALRLVSRFEFPELNEPGTLAARYPDPPLGGLLVVDEAVRAAEFGRWENEIGELTGRANALDFRDLEPGRGPDHSGPRLRLGVRHLSQLVRYNEPEGVFTGLGVTLNPGRAWEEGRIRAHAGWAWSEGTVRGGLEVSHVEEESRWEWLLRGARQIRSTGDFGPAWARDEEGVPPIVAGEDELFYDHWTVGAIARQPPDAGWSWRFEAARGEDRRIELPDVETTDPVAVASVDEGAYWLGRATLQRNPEAAGLGVTPGVAVRLSAETAAGDLEWTRLEAGVSARGLWDPFSLEGRVDAGVIFSDRPPPPQRLFELGRYHGLPGYPPRAFVGDQAVLAQTAFSYTLPLLRRPFAVGGFYLPAPAPAPTVILRAGWTDVWDNSSPVMTELGAVTTDGIRSTVDLRLRFFGGGMSVGAARPLDSGGRWRFVWSLAREF